MMNNPNNIVAGQNPCDNMGVKNGIHITKAEKRRSDALKASKRKTIKQLPVYRSASNISYVVAQIIGECPKKYRLILDSVEALSDGVLIDLDLAYEDKGNRVCYCTEAHSKMYALGVKLEVLKNLGAISKDTYNKVMALCSSTLAQISAWRMSVMPSGSIM